MAYPLFRVEGSNTASTSCVVTLQCSAWSGR